MKLLHRRLIDRRFRPATTVKDIRGSLDQKLLPLIDHRRVNAVPARQLGDRPFPLQRLQRHTRLERGIVLSAFRHR
jgi:hypothetical protein